MVSLLRGKLDLPGGGGRVGQHEHSSMRSVHAPGAGAGAGAGDVPPHQQKHHQQQQQQQQQQYASYQEPTAPAPAPRRRSSSGLTVRNGSTSRRRVSGTTSTSTASAAVAATSSGAAAGAGARGCNVSMPAIGAQYATDRVTGGSGHAATSAPSSSAAKYSSSTAAKMSAKHQQQLQQLHLPEDMGGNSSHAQGSTGYTGMFDKFKSMAFSSGSQQEQEQQQQQQQHGVGEVASDGVIHSNIRQSRPPNGASGGRRSGATNSAVVPKESPRAAVPAPAPTAAGSGASAISVLSARRSSLKGGYAVSNPAAGAAGGTEYTCKSGVAEAVAVVESAPPREKGRGFISSLSGLGTSLGVLPSAGSSSGGTAAAHASKSKSAKDGSPVCDKCDGKHETDACPYFKKPREAHPDATSRGKGLGSQPSTLPGATLRSSAVRVVRQPGDGSCLFHSMAYGLGGTNATALRSEICNFMSSNPQLLISDSPISDWVKWDSGSSVGDYARKMVRGGAWGGGIEMAIASRIRNVNVHVYERARDGGYKRISAFDVSSNASSRPVVRVLYCGGVHYDALA